MINAVQVKRADMAEEQRMANKARKSLIASRIKKVRRCMQSPRREWTGVEEMASTSSSKNSRRSL